MYSIKSLGRGEGFCCIEDCILFLLKGEVAVIDNGTICKRVAAEDHLFVEGSTTCSLTAITISELMLVGVKNEE